MLDEARSSALRVWSPCGAEQLAAFRGRVRTAAQTGGRCRRREHPRLGRPAGRRVRRGDDATDPVSIVGYVSFSLPFL